MIGTDHSGGLNKTVAQQHVQIEALVETIHNRFESELKVTRNLFSLLNSLAAHLEMHFELEEKGGYFAGVIRKAPRLAGRAEVLLEEHMGFLENSHELVKMARGAFANDAEVPALAARFEQLRRGLLTHERAEIDLLQEAYTRDIGSMD